MSRVSESAKGIDAVIEGLDKIAFQTRVLAMNAAVELESQSFAQVARQFLAGQHTTPAATPARAFFAQLTDGLGRLTQRHLMLVGISTGVAVLLGVPLGLAAARRRIKQPILAVVGVLQTIPSLALLAMLIPIVGSIGVVPALIALALYALLLSAGLVLA